MPTFMQPNKKIRILRFIVSSIIHNIIVSAKLLYFFDYPISNDNSNDDLMPISYDIGSRIQLISAFGKTYKSKKCFVVSSFNANFTQETETIEYGKKTISTWNADFRTCT